MRTPIAVILLSSLLIPASVQAYASDSDVGVSTPAIRITTGVIGPAVINARNFTVTADALNGVGVEKPEVVLALRVDEKGIAQNVRVVHSVNARVDAQVLSAARDFRFRPATLDNQPVAIDLNLTVVVQR